MLWEQGNISHEYPSFMTLELQKGTCVSSVIFESLLVMIQTTLKDLFDQSLKVVSFSEQLSKRGKSDLSDLFANQRETHVMNYDQEVIFKLCETCTKY